jgi:hypothetical protein
VERIPPPPGRDSGETYHHRERPKRAAVAASAIALGLAAVLLVRRRSRLSRLENRGASMAPTLLPGDWALSVAVRHPRRRHVVLIDHPERPGLEMVKRVVGAPGDVVHDGRRLGDDEWWVEGDFRRRSTDSRDFGPVPRRAIKARVSLIYWPPSRLRRV